MSEAKVSRVAALAFIVGTAFGVQGCSKTEPPSSETKAVASASGTTTSPLAGQIGGESFTLKKVTLVTAKGFGEWRISLEGSTPSAEAAAIRLPARAALGLGKTVENKPTGLKAGVAVPSVNVQRGPSNTTSSNATYRIEITKWDVKPCPIDDASFHEGGLASGRILIRVPDEKVELAGTFTDAVVKYGATPDWAYQ